MSGTHHTETIHDLKVFHSRLIPDFGTICRIPGGFIYTQYFPGRNTDSTSIFVPLSDSYDDECDPSIPRKDKPYHARIP